MRQLSVVVSVSSRMRTASLFRVAHFQVLQLLLARDSRGDTLISCAVKCKNIGLLQIVLEAVALQGRAERQVRIGI